MGVINIEQDKQREIKTGNINNVDKFKVGKAGEHIVCADLLLKNLVPNMADEALPYDILLDIGHKVLKVQVKTTITHRTTNQWKGINEAYVFNVKRKGANGNKRYSDYEVDVFAIVALDTKQIGYLKNCDMPTTINIRVDAYRGQYHDEMGEVRRQQVQAFNVGGNTIEDIARMSNLGKTSVRNYLKGDFEPHKTKAIYMSDLQREMEWFFGI